MAVRCFGELRGSLPEKPEYCWHQLEPSVSHIIPSLKKEERALFPQESICQKIWIVHILLEQETSLPSDKNFVIITMCIYNVNSAYGAPLGHAVPNLHISSWRPPF